MSSRPVTFVLGAGASVPYGYPSGQLLIQKIADRISAQSDHLMQLVIDWPEGPAAARAMLKEIRRGLVSSAVASIDQYVASRRERSAFCKALIALELLSCESKDANDRFCQVKEGCWYRWLHSKLVTSTPESYPRCNVQFITFNYDRSLEFFLDSAIADTYEMTMSDASLVRQRIPIYHVFGSLGKLPYENSSNSTVEQLSYGSKRIVSRSIIEASRSITTIGESEGHFLQKEFLRNALSSERDVVFLGYGYHTSNNQILPIPHSRGSVYGSCYKLSKGEIETAKSSWQGVMFDIGDPSHDCLAFLREHDFLG